MHKFSKWIFDLDGTLTKTQHNFDHIRRELGIPDGVLILEYINSLPSSEANILLARLSQLEKEPIADVQIAEGAMSLLELLQSRSNHLGILTLNTQENAIQTLEKIDLKRFFSDDVIVGREQRPPKPAADGVLYLLNQWKTNQDDSVIVGDFHLDLKTGRNAGIMTILVGEPDQEDCNNNLIDFSVHSLFEIVRLIRY